MCLVNGHQPAFQTMLRILISRYFLSCLTFHSLIVTCKTLQEQVTRWTGREGTGDVLTHGFQHVDPLQEVLFYTFRINTLSVIFKSIMLVLLAMVLFHQMVGTYDQYFSWPCDLKGAGSWWKRAMVISPDEFQFQRGASSEGLSQPIFYVQSPPPTFNIQWLLWLREIRMNLGGKSGLVNYWKFLRVSPAFKN